MNECAPVTQVQVGSLLFFMINDDDDVTQHSNDDERENIISYVTHQGKISEISSFILF